MTIVRIARIVLETKILIGEFAGQKRLIPRIKLNSAQENFAYIISRIQFAIFQHNDKRVTRTVF